jgi:NO-binding membrane sensor protein with MHYT domain
MIMVVASSSTLEMVVNFYQAKRNMKWLLFSSFIMGVGIWTFHFMGMLGNDIHGFASYRQLDSPFFTYCLSLFLYEYLFYDEIKS